MRKSHPGSLNLDNNELLKSFTRLFLFLLKLLSRIFSFKSKDILVISFNNIGDTILSLHALKQFSKETDSKITLLTYDKFKFLFEKELSGIKTVFVKSNEFSLGGKIPTFSVIKKARENRCGVVINFSENPQSVFTMLFSGGRRFYGIARDAYRTAFDSYKIMRKEPHLIDIYFDAVDSFQKISREENSRIFPLVTTRGDQIIITPFAGWDEKMWGLKKMISLAEELCKSYKVNFVVERGKLDNDIISTIKQSGIAITELDSIDEYGTILQSTALLVANDTGPIHVAAYYGLPTVSIFGPTNPDFCKQPGDQHIAINKILLCSPDEFNYCDYDAGRTCPVRECLTRISVEEVKNRVISHYNKYSHTV